MAIKVSVLLAVYNGEKYLEKSLRSLVGQTYSDIEILIGFNGTTDGSKEIVERFDDSRIKVFDYANEKGKARTLNKLFKESQGEWIAIQDDDDVWMPDKLESQMIYSEDFDIIGTQIKYINEEDEVIGEVELELNDLTIKKKSLAGYNQVANTTALVRRRCIEKIGEWRTDIEGIEDFDFWLRLMREGYKFLNLQEVKVFHRLHSKSNFNTKKHDLSLILDGVQNNGKRKFWMKINNFFRKVVNQKK